MTPRLVVSIVGTKGVPAAYGGFETLAENLARYHYEHGLDINLEIYCSGKPPLNSEDTKYLGARLHHIDLRANGFQSIMYDAISLLTAIRNKADVILLLGISGAIALPLVRLVSRCHIITNLDGVEWRRQKWKGLARLFLKFSEQLAVKWSHTVVADNDAIKEYVLASYGVKCNLIVYGGDHALATKSVSSSELLIPENYCLALCRIEPENNVSMILDAFSRLPENDLVFVGNWDSSPFSRAMRSTYSAFSNLYLVDAIYDQGLLRWIRDGATCYVHGHSAGGTNPSLVEMMHFAAPVFAYDCSYNRYSTEGKAIFFRTAEELMAAVTSTDILALELIGDDMKEVATKRYTWDRIAKAYFALFQSEIN